MKVDSIYDLIGAEVSAVSFVLSGLELYFDRQILRLLLLPSFIEMNRAVVAPDADIYQNRLCTLIGDKVASLEVKEDSHLSVSFKSRKKIVVNADPISEPEFVHYVSREGGPIQVW